MIDRRDILVGSATALTASFLTPSPALAQATTVPGTKRGFLERPGCRIYYEVTGSGPPIIFAHGVGSNHQTWWQQVPHFFDRFTCVTFSHRGYPPSSEIGMPDPGEFAGDLASLIEHRLATPRSALKSASVSAKALEMLKGPTLRWGLIGEFSA